MSFLKITLSLILVGLVTVSIIDFLPQIKSVMNLGRWNGDRSAGKSRVRRQGGNIGDQNPLPDVITSAALPMMPNNNTVINTRYMPTLGNGYIGTTVYGSTVHLNALYAGSGEKSHRAEIPAFNMFRIGFKQQEIENNAHRTYTLDSKRGLFVEEIKCQFATIKHYTYIHQHFVRLFVTHITAVREDNTSPGLIELQYIPLVNSSDFAWTSKTFEGVDWIKIGKVNSAESSSNSRGTVYVYHHELTESIHLRGSPTYSDTMLMSVDTKEAAAKEDFVQARNIINKDGHQRLLKLHVDAWRDTWKQGKVTVEGSRMLEKLTNFAQFYLMSSMPPIFPSQPLQYAEIFSGHSRTSLGRGSLGRDYQGHLFWDSEMYILPAILPFHPKLAKYMLRYRSAYRNAAENHAKSMNKVGYRYPWESAATGIDVTPDTCINCREKQLFVSGAVNWAIRQYYSFTKDNDFLKSPDYEGCQISIETAKFLQSLAVFNSSTARYDIADVTGPDDWHPGVTNNAFMNVLTSLAIHWARYVACKCDLNDIESVPDDWMEVALYLDLPFNNDKRVHYAHRGYEFSNNRSVKQADTVLITFPLAWNTSKDIMRNDLLLYQEQMEKVRTPSMTWSFVAAGYQFVEEHDRVRTSFERSYMPYTINPFKIWTEYEERNAQDQLEGSVNFLPGAAGFMQSLIYGFGGLRIRPEFLEFHNPSVPPDCSVMTFEGFSYLSSNLTITISQIDVIIDAIEVGQFGLILRKNGTSKNDYIDVELFSGSHETISNPKMGFYLMPKEGASCEHPRDHIYMPWGYSPFISGTSSVYASSWTIFFSSFMFCALGMFMVSTI